MRASIRTWGNSYGVRLPINALIESDISLDDELDIIVGKNEITLIKKTDINMRDYFKPSMNLVGWKFNREELYGDED